MCLGRAIRISIEAERDWRADRERPHGPEAKKIAVEARTRSSAGRRAGQVAATSELHVSKRRGVR